MNNNRGNNNNRRRSRGGNRSQNNQFPNRIDSRARGNAAQMLDKHKKLANDAQMNDDRVQTEYHLQFADHYFRVIADNKARQDEQRGSKRDDDRDTKNYQRDDDDGEDDGQDYRQKRPRRPRNNEGEEATQGREQTEGNESGGKDNPFTRPRPVKSESKSPDKSPAKPAAKPRAPRSAKPNGNSGGESNGLDPSALPPSIGDEGDAPKPRRRVRRVSGNEGSDNSEAVG